MINLSNKKILVFVPHGRGIYGSAIEQVLKLRGAEVTIYDERPTSTTFGKIALRVAKESLEKIILNYLVKIIQNHKNDNFDYILIIRGEAFTKNAMTLLNNSYPRAKKILYLWDSVKNTDTSQIFSFFNKVLSFDESDCKTFGLTHRPLFFIDDYQRVSESNELKYDVAFIGTVHSDRYIYAKNIKKQADLLNMSSYFYFYLPSKILFYKYKLNGSLPQGTNLEEFNFKMIPANEASNLLGYSKASIDIQHIHQTGLTMRTLEVYGAKRKLITTNQKIRDYDFFDENNIQIVDRKNPKLDFDFINSPYKVPSPELYYKYSIHGWLDDLLV